MIIPREKERGKEAGEEGSGKEEEEAIERRGKGGEKRGKEKIKKEKRRNKDGPGPVMVSDTLCPSVHILGT